MALSKAIAIVLVLLTLSAMGAVFAAGTQSDPVVSQAYAEGTYRDSLLDLIAGQVSKETSLEERLATLEERPEIEFVQGPVKQTLMVSDEIELIPGSSFTLTKGAASVKLADGAVINVTRGEVIKAGAELNINERYFCAEDKSAVIAASATSEGYADGYHTIEISMITRFVMRLYTEILGRTYDEQGLQGWVEIIKGGISTGADIAYGFVFSREITDKNLSDKDFTDMLYRAILGRKPEKEGLDGWLEILNSGQSRESVFYGFINSVEFNDICIMYGMLPPGDSAIPAGLRTFVTRLYTECLGREPDEQGKNGWIEMIHSGEITGTQTAYGFVFSKEVNDKNLSNEDFIEMLYKTMLGRESEPEGKANWVNALRSGTSREDVFQEFTDSQEFINICETTGVRR